MITFATPNYSFVGYIILTACISLILLLVLLGIRYFRGFSPFLLHVIIANSLVFVISVSLLVMFRYTSTEITNDVKYEASVNLAFDRSLKKAVERTHEFITSEKTHDIFGKLDNPQYITKKYKRSPSDYYHYGMGNGYVYHYDFAIWGGIGGAENNIDLSLKLDGKTITFLGLSELTAYPYHGKLNGIEIKYKKKQSFDKMYIDYEDALNKLTELGWSSQRMTLAKWKSSIEKKYDGFAGGLFEPKLYQHIDDNYKVVIRMLYYREQNYGYIIMDITKNSEH